MSSKSRIFTATMWGLQSLNVAADTWELAVAQWTTEEDVEILGFSMSASCHEADIPVDGVAGSRFELTQVGVGNRPGSLCVVNTSVLSYIVVAAAQMAQIVNSEKVVMFSGPERLTMPEGNVLYIHAFKYGLVLKTVNAHVEATIYYRKL